jgi:hypothetical protein
MSALKSPSHLADPAHVDSGEAHLKFELLEDIDSAVGHTERDVERTLRALRDFDSGPGGDREARARLLDGAVEAVWRLVVQHEACDCADHRELVARYRIPDEVLRRIGGGPRVS